MSTSEPEIRVRYQVSSKQKNKKMRLPGVEPGSIAWKAIILTVGLQTLLMFISIM